MGGVRWWTAKIDEERSGEHHPESWLSFAEALGVARETVPGSEPLPATQALIDTFVDLTKCQPLVAGLAARLFTSRRFLLWLQLMIGAIRHRRRSDRARHLLLHYLHQAARGGESRIGCFRLKPRKVNFYQK